MVSKKITDLSHKQEGISSGEEGGEEEEEKSGALACRYASTQSPPLTSARGDSKLHSYFQIQFQVPYRDKMRGEGMKEQH